MKLLQLNAWGGRLEPQINDLLEAGVCDYIFVNDAIKVHDFKALSKIASDHQALRMDFDV